MNRVWCEGLQWTYNGRSSECHVHVQTVVLDTAIMRVVQSSQKQNTHLEAKDVHIHSLILDPLLLIHDVDEDAGIENKAAEKHDHQIVAHLGWGICATIYVCLLGSIEETHGHVDWLLHWPAIDLIVEAKDSWTPSFKQLVKGIFHF